MASENDTPKQQQQPSADVAVSAPNGGGNHAPASNPLPSANAERKNNAGSDDQPKSESKDRDQRSGSGRGRDRGGRGGRGGGRGQDQNRGKRKERGFQDRRGRNDDWQDKKRKRLDRNGTAAATGGGDASDQQQSSSYMSIPFSQDEIAAEERRPKRKVAVLIGYSGTGYHGLQINHDDKTIEGDLFAALVAAQAISKANASDPKKSSFVRCARTDKGVHAAGNMVSLKLIIEDPDVVQKINAALPPQIRVWGIHRTNNAFSCYQACDSRWYEYLMPSYCLLPPHPESYLGKKVLESVKEKGLENEYAERLGEVKDYWAEVEERDIKPILDSLDPELREAVVQRIHASEKEIAAKDELARASAGGEPSGAVAKDVSKGSSDVATEDVSKETPAIAEAAAAEESTVAADLASAPAKPEDVKEAKEAKEAKTSPLDLALKQIKAAYMAAKRRYRASPERIARLQEALDQYVGTRNYHNYTIQKSHGDPSAKRVIKSFVVDPAPIQINDTQWLSLKVHGQSFMMHQIRKMVGMSVLATRCGSADPAALIPQSYGPARISIPKAPGLGLLLERPVFNSYNRRAVDDLGLEALDFANYEDEIRRFKDEHIYRRIFELEEKENSFHTFFHQIDNFKSDYFLWVTAGGLEAAQQRMGPQDRIPKELEKELGNESDDPEAGDG